MSLSTCTVTICVLDSTKPKSSLYYYQGNFFYPLFYPDVGFIKKQIRQWLAIPKNKAMFESDRKSPEYLTVVELMDVEPYDN
jgi:hypothetical protein